MADAYTRPYGDATSSNFPKMGEHPLEGTIVNTSGDRSAYTQSVARPTQGDALATGGTAIRGASSMSGEHNGPRFAPVTTISYPNSPEASQTGRGLRPVPSSVGNRDFWQSRQENYGGEVIH